MMRAYDRGAAWMRRGALSASAVMLIIIVLQTLVAPSGGRHPNVVVWCALSLPLLIFLPGLWRASPRSYAWLSFVSLLYFAQAVTALFVAQQRLLDQLNLVASVALFICTLLFVRWRARVDRAAATL
jgi:uncharacterized membrane protein